MSREHGIQLLVDAAHPFAEQLHKNIGQAAEELNIPVPALKKLAEFYQTSVDYLLGLTDEKRPYPRRPQ